MENTFSWFDFWSAFAGAAFAFLVERAQRFRDRGRDEQEAANRALLSLAQMYTDLTLIWRQVYVSARQRVRGTMGRDPVAMEILPMQLPPEPATSLDVASLSFLLRTHDPNLVNELALVESCYTGDLGIERERARMHLEAQAKLQAAGLKEHQSYTAAEAEEMIGQAQLRQLEFITASQLDHIPKTLESIKKARDELSTVASLHLPTRMVVTFSDIVGDDKGAPVPTAAPWRYVVRGAARWIRKRLRSWNVT